MFTNNNQENPNHSDSHEALMALHNKLDRIANLLRTLINAEHNHPASSYSLEDRLITSQQILKILNMRYDDKAWQNTRCLLISRYGMGRVPGTGYRMLESQLNRFLSDYYTPKNN
jgi:hypothetical protein